MSLSKKTIDGLRATMKAIAEEPRRFNMMIWGEKVTEDAPGKSRNEALNQLHGAGWESGSALYDAAAELPPCGTVGCLAGWAVLALADEETKAKFFHEWEAFPGVFLLGGAGEPWEVPDLAKELLGLTSQQKHMLFYIDSWPRAYRDQYSIANKLADVAARPAARVAALNRLVEDFIAMDGDLKELEGNFVS